MFSIIRSVRSEVTCLAGAALFLLIFKVLLSGFMPELPEIVVKIGDVFERLCSSIVASYIFFLIVVQLKSETDKKTVSPYVSKTIQLIIQDCESQLNAFQQKSGIVLNFQSLTENNLKLAFRSIAPYSDAPLVLGNIDNKANWLQYMEFYRQRSSFEIDKLLRQIVYLDAKLVTIVSEIDSCCHFSITRQFVSLNFPITNES